MNVRHVIQGWWKTIMKDAESEPMMKQRASACLSCPESKVGMVSTWIKGEYEEIQDMICSKCGCPLEQKLRVENETCPLNKW